MHVCSCVMNVWCLLMCVSALPPFCVMYLLSLPVSPQVMSFESEAELLKRWTSLVLETDPDVITGTGAVM